MVLCHQSSGAACIEGSGRFPDISVTQREAAVFVVRYLNSQFLRAMRIESELMVEKLISNKIFLAMATDLLTKHCAQTLLRLIS